MALALAYSEHLGPAHGAHTPGRWLAILHRYGLVIFTFVVIGSAPESNLDHAHYSVRLEQYLHYYFRSYDLVIILQLAS